MPLTSEQRYQEMQLNAFRYLGINNFLDFERLTITEYNFLVKVNALKKIDREEELYSQAWLNWQVQATKTQGKKEVPAFSSFGKFFDKQKAEDKILGKKREEVKNDDNLIRLLKKANE
ncbi:hypothetical protein ACRPK2_03975 [Lactococcus garvieae]|uniref:hypothetical protein n=1 Tax=Lactococcus garvieae TaxID=1363 RepID=UPI003D78A78F